MDKAEIDERRVAVLQGCHAGLDSRAIAHRLGVVVRTVERDKAALKAAGHDIRPLIEQNTHLPTPAEHERQTRERTGGVDMRRDFLNGRYSAT